MKSSVKALVLALVLALMMGMAASAWASGGQNHGGPGLGRAAARGSGPPLSDATAHDRPPRKDGGHDGPAAFRTAGGRWNWRIGVSKGVFVGSVQGCNGPILPRRRLFVN